MQGKSTKEDNKPNVSLGNLVKYCKRPMQRERKSRKESRRMERVEGEKGKERGCGENEEKSRLGEGRKEKGQVGD